MDFTELRKHPRVNVDFVADWGWGPEGEHYDKITSLSVNGCFLAARRGLDQGDEIYLRLGSESYGVINLKGAIRYISCVLWKARHQPAWASNLSASQTRSKPNYSK